MEYYLSIRIMITKNFNNMRRDMFYAKSKMQYRKCNKVLRKIKEKICTKIGHCYLWLVIPPPLPSVILYFVNIL